MNLRTALIVWAAAKRARKDVIWSSRLAEHFWHPSGVPLVHSDVQANLDAYNEAVAGRIADISAELGNEARSLGSWQTAMHNEVKDAWRVNYMAGRGGRHWMGPEDWGRIGGQLNFQYDRLDNFAREIAAGDLSPAQISARANLYANAPWRAHQSARQVAKIEANFAEERRNEVMDHNTCAGCAHWHSLGWQPIGTIPEPGSECECGANCRGEMEFRGQRFDELVRHGDLDEVYQHALDGGVTYHPMSGVINPTEGIAFSTWEGRTKLIPAELFDKGDLRQFIHANSDQLLQTRDPKYLGSWIEEGKICLDVSRVFPPEERARAVRLAYAHNQKALFDLGTFEELDTKKEFFKLMDEAKVQYYRSLGKKLRPVKRVLVQVPNVGEEEYEKFLERYVDHVRKLAGVAPLYEDKEE